MAEITKSANASLASQTPPAVNKISGLVAGEAIGALDACYIKSDGTVWRSTGAAANAAAKVRGYAMMAQPTVGEPVSLYHGVVANYGTGLTPGANLYLSGTVAGGLADAASTGGVNPIGFVIDANRVYLDQSNY